MKNITFLLLLSTILVSCATKRRCDLKYPPETKVKDSVVITTKDSVVIKTKYALAIKDSIVIKEAVKGKDSVDCKENSKTIVRNGEDKFTIEVKNGKVYLDYDLKGTISTYQSKIEKLENDIIQTHISDSLKYHETLKVKTIGEGKGKWYTQLWLWIKDLLSLIGLIYVIVQGLKMVVRRFSE